jgi:GntP family gluconate:H+ symporter
LAPSVSLSGHDAWLIGCAVSAILGIVVLIGAGKVHPFLALIVASAWVGATAGLPTDRTLSAFQKGVGETLGGVGVLLALGTMLGKLLAESGAADRVVAVVLERTDSRRLPWAMALAAMLIGIPLFFEVGLVLLMPIIVVMARRAGTSAFRVGFPALAALSVCHGLIPPHPGPLVAANALHADLGQTLGYGLLIAVPTTALSGPIFGNWIARRVHPRPSAELLEQISEVSPGAQAPGFAVTLATMLLPVLLMIARTVAELAHASGPAYSVAVFVGHPIAAMTIALFVAMFTLGRPYGLRRQVSAWLAASLAPIGGMVLIIGAGGGFKQTLVESGIGAAIGRAAQSAGVPILILGWLLAVAIRVATGSATVATVTASGILAPLASTLPPGIGPLLALSIGCGSLFFSHVNDAGFWLVKEYFGLTVGDTLKSWSTMETIISVVGLGCVVALHWIV